MVRAELKGAMNFIFLCRLRLLIRQGTCEIDLFTDTAAILNLLVLRSIMGCPGGISLSIYPRRELHCLFLGKKAITITSKHRTTIFFSHYNRDFKIQRRGRQGERQKTIGFRSKTTLHVHHTFLYISFPVFARLRRENA